MKHISLSLALLCALAIPMTAHADAPGPSQSITTDRAGHAGVAHPLATIDCGLTPFGWKAGPTTLGGEGYVSCASREKTIEIEVYAQQCFGVVFGVCIAPGATQSMGPECRAQDAYSLWCPAIGAYARTVGTNSGWIVTVATIVLPYSGTGMFVQYSTGPIGF